MKITPSILSIPPYLSTSWETIASIQSQPSSSGVLLLVTLKNGASVEVPGLEPTAIHEIFEAHARYGESAGQTLPSFPNPISFSFPIKSDETLASMNAAMQHNPEQSDGPEIPPEILSKLTAVAKAFGLDDSPLLSAPEPECRCTYCQIARTLVGASKEKEEEEQVTEADLHFRDWEVRQSADQLYTVSNPLDANEHYTVFLGTPIGCTCGQNQCEHIKAVLST